MSTLKVDSIENGGAAVNFPANLKAGNGYAEREYYDQTTEPTGVADGAIWWNDSDETLKMYIDGEWYTVGLVPTVPPWYGSRGLFGGGRDVSSVRTNVIDYVTISTPSNAVDFGDLTVARNNLASCSDGTYGLFGGGYNSNVIDYVTIATTGNAIDFGDLTVGRYDLASCSDGTYGLFGGGRNSGFSNVIDYVTIATPGNATDFGDLTVARDGVASCSGN